MDHGAATVETWERRAGAALSALPGAPAYRRREPERTLLHAVVRDRLEPFLAAARERSPSGRGLPAHVERDLRAYLDCGVLARGFARVRCPGCGFERLVAFSCKARSCPSCNARRMEDAADHLVHDVFPRVPVRQWVLSLPHRLRFQAARDPKVASRLLDLFTRAVFAWQRRQARRLGAADPRTAGCTAVQRFGSAINLNVHFHTLVPDGVFDLTSEGPARFIPLKAPSDEEVERILTVVIHKVARAGLLDAGEDHPGAEEDAFAALQAGEVDRRLRFPDPFTHARRAAFLDGFSLHAGVRIHEHDREGLEKLCRYAVRPPFALHRLSEGPDGRLVYRMKRPRGGSLFLVLTPDELISRIATLVPPPRSHALRYHGVFAPHSKHRARVVPAGGRRDAGHGGLAGRHRPGDHAVSAAVEVARASEPRPEPPGTFRLTAPGDAPPDRPSPRIRVPWAELLRKVFAIDVLECPACGGRLELIAFIAEHGVARRILDHLGLESQAPPLARARAPDDPGSAATRPTTWRATPPTTSDRRLVTVVVEVRPRHLRERPAATLAERPACVQGSSAPQPSVESVKPK